MSQRTSTSWATAVERAARSVSIQISNLTHLQLKLRGASNESGEWALSPPNVIPPWGEGKLAVVCSTPFTGAEVKVVFGIIGLPRSTANIQFSAGNHLISGRYSSAAISTNEERNFAIRKKENDDSQYAITWTIKTSHAPPTLDLPSRSPASSVASSTASKAPPQNVERGLPSESLAVTDSQRKSTEGDAVQSSTSALAGTSSWKIQVNVLNDSQYSWNLDEKGLESGHWSREPQMELKPYSRASWHCLPSFAGSIGYAKYHCNNAPSVIFFTKWTAKVVSAPQVDALVQGPQPRILDSELKVSHTKDCIIVDVTIFETGSYRKGVQGMPQISQELIPKSNLPAPSSSSSAPRAPSVSASSVALRVFRLPIEILVDREGRGTQVPWLVESICDWLISDHCTTRGLFMQTGLYHEIKELKALIESGSALRKYEEDRVVPWQNFSPGSVVAVFKVFLRELPVSLVPLPNVLSFISLESQDSASSYTEAGAIPNISTPSPTSEAATHSSSASNAANMQVIGKAISKVLNELPPVHKATLMYIAQAFNRLWKAHGSVHTLDALSIVFGPLVAPDKPDGSFKSTLPAISAFATLVEYINKAPEARRLSREVSP